MMITRRMAALGGATLAATGLASPAVAQRTTTLRYIPVTDLTSIDPIWTTSTAVRNHGYLVYDTLFGTDTAYNVRPQMAEGVEVSSDGLVTSIRLRQGLRFHDNEPVLARDCVASIKRWAAKDATGQVVLTLLDELSAPDDRTIRIRLTTPFPGLVPALVQLNSPPPFMMPERIALTPPDKQIKDAVGSGPFRFLSDEWLSGSRAGYARFDGYAARPEAANGTAGGKRALVDRVEWNVVPDANTAMSALQTGSADFYEIASPDLLPIAARNRDLVITTLEPVGSPIVLRMNQLQPPFRSQDLRRALLAAVDQTAFLDAAMGDPAYQTECKAFLPCGTPFSIGSGSDAMTGNIAAAREMVRQSGYDGTRAVILTPTDTPLINACCNVADDLLKRIGIKSDLVAMDFGTLIARRASTEPVANGGWSIFITYGESALFSNPATNIGLRVDWPGWPNDPKLQVLRKAFMMATDDGSRHALATQIEQAAFTSVPYIPLGMMHQPSIYRRSLSEPIRIGIPLLWNIVKA